MCLKDYATRAQQFKFFEKQWFSLGIGQSGFRFGLQVESKEGTGVKLVPNKLKIMDGLEEMLRQWYLHLE